MDFKPAFTLGVSLLATVAFAWTTPVPLASPVNSTYNDYSPSLGVYEGTTYLFLVSERAGGVGLSDLWFATGTPPNFGTPTHMGSAVNSSTYEGGPCICWTGGPTPNTLYFYSNRSGGQGGGFDLYQTTYSGGLWSAPVGVGTNVNTGGQEYYAYVTTWQGEIRMYFVRDGSIYYSPYSGGQWGSVVPVALGSGDAYHPCVRGEGSGAKMYFSSTRPGGFGSYDMYVSTYAGGVWGSPLNLGPTVNTAYSDACPWFAPDGQTMYFSSDRPGGPGGYDIWYTVLENPGVAPASLGKVKTAFK